MDRSPAERASSPGRSPAQPHLQDALRGPVGGGLRDFVKRREAPSLVPSATIVAARCRHTPGLLTLRSADFSGYLSAQAAYRRDVATPIA
jgi:hypothetical protein